MAYPREVGAGEAYYFNLQLGQRGTENRRSTDSKRSLLAYIQGVICRSDICRSAFICRSVYILCSSTLISMHIAQ